MSINLNPATCVIAGVEYVAVEQDGCNGCVTHPGSTLCITFRCGRAERPDKKSVIWIKNARPYSIQQQRDDLLSMLDQMIACHGEESCPAVDAARELMGKVRKECGE